MGEKYIIFEGESVSFEGLFSIKGLVSAIKDWSDDKKWDFQEKKRIETVKEDGRFAKIEFTNEIKSNDYTKLIMKIKVELSGVKDTVVEVKGKRRRVQQGKVTVKVEAEQKSREIDEEEVEQGLTGEPEVSESTPETAPEPEVAEVTEEKTEEIPETTEKESDTSDQGMNDDFLSFDGDDDDLFE